jgi:hypothetical protein
MFYALTNTTIFISMVTYKKFIRVFNMKQFKLLLIAISFFALSNAQAELVTNGSLTGTVTNGYIAGGQDSRLGLPSEWRALVSKGATNNSPDTMDVDNYGGLPASPTFFRQTPSLSPNGGTWVGVARDSGIATNEVFGQAISGFTIGTTYQLSWYDANFGGLVTNRYDDPNFFVATLSDLATSNALETFTGSSRSVAAGWAQQSFSFIASQTNYFLTLGLGSSVDSSYMSIDGISITAVAAVPEPQTWALMAGGLLLIGFNARRRQLNS